MFRDESRLHYPFLLLDRVPVTSADLANESVSRRAGRAVDFNNCVCITSKTGSWAGPEVGLGEVLPGLHRVISAMPVSGLPTIHEVT